MKRRNSSKNRSTDQHFDRWFRHYNTPELIQQAENLPLRQDMITLFIYVQNNKVIGTQSTGNLPLKAVREVTARFVNPPALESQIGNTTYKIRSEADLWSLHYLHILAEVGNLLKTPKARQWKLSHAGKAFLDSPPLIQTTHLFTIWWHQVNWLVAYPYSGMGEGLPPFFTMQTAEYLQKQCVVGDVVPFDLFADGLIEKTGLVWGASDSPYARTSLQGAVTQMVISILEKFGGVRCHYREESVGKGTIEKLEAFELTQLGKALLDVVFIMMI